MVQKKVCVFDPFRSWQGREFLVSYHNDKCDTLLEGLAKCFENFFVGYAIDTSEWYFDYYEGFGIAVAK
jgi:hypothetical protein